MTVNLCFVFQCRSFRECVTVCTDDFALNFDFIPEAFLSQLEVLYCTYFCGMLIQQSVQGLEFCYFRSYNQWPCLCCKMLPNWGNVIFNTWPSVYRVKIAWLKSVLPSNGKYNKFYTFFSFYISSLWTGLVKNIYQIFHLDMIYGLLETF